jgi:hypothetical protein
VEVDEDLKFYQRLQTKDEDGAIAMLEESLKTRSLDEVFDKIVIPVLARTEQDRARGALELNDVVFHFRIVQEWLDDLEENVDTLALPAPTSEAATVAGEEAEPFRVVGIATDGTGGVLVLRMVRLLLAKTRRVELDIIQSMGTPLVLAEQIAEKAPDALLLSHLPTESLTRVRYLIKRLKSSLADLPMVVGYWDKSASLPEIQDSLKAVSIYRVALEVDTARDALLGMTPTRDKGLASTAAERMATAGAPVAKP